MDTALLIPAIIGWTEATKTQFPSVSKLSPFIALVIAGLLYWAQKHLGADLFNLFYMTGSAMGVYTGVKTVGTITIK